MTRLLKLLKPYRISIILVLAFIFLQSLSSLYLPNLMSDIVDTGIAKVDIPYIIRIGGFMLLVTVAGVLFSIMASWLAARISTGFGKTLRAKLFAHVEGFVLHEFDQIGTASLVTRTTNDITQVQQFVNMSLRMMVMAPMMAIGGIIMAILTDAKLSLVIVVIIPILALTIYAVLRKGISLFRAMQFKIDRLNRVLRENLIGIRVIRSFNRIDYEKNRFDEANFDLTDTATRVNRIMASMQPLMMLIINLSTLAILWFGGIRINDGAMLIGNLMAFLQYVMQILFAVMMVSMMFFMIPRASASATRINEVLDLTPMISDHDALLTVKDTERSGLVEFQNVFFSYPGAEKPALEGISFRALPGQITAIIGGTGSGKSTLINLIPRFYDSSSGSILIDHMNICDLSQEELRSMIGYVPQKAVLFSGTIADNIRYGKEDAADEEIRHAAEVAQATEFIDGMQEGMDTYISQGGTNVSGGQKQRLSIARAIVRRPLIYLFDDSFSALDFTTDAKLRTALKAETNQSTVLIVAQRVSTIMDADQIIVLDDGRIAGIGKHQELMNTCTVYREIVTSQLSEEEIA